MRKEDSLLFPAIMSAMTGPAAYAMDLIVAGHSKPRRGRLVGCHICGAAGCTLFKDGERRICKKCKEEKA